MREALSSTSYDKINQRKSPKPRGFPLVSDEHADEPTSRFTRSEKPGILETS